MNEPRTVNPSRPSGPGTSQTWRTTDLMVVVVVALVFGAIYVAWAGPYQWVAAFGGTPTQEAANGLWFVAGLLGPYLIRRPGAALASEVLASLAELPYSWWDYGYFELDLPVLATMLVTRTVGVAVAGVIAKYLGDALVLTGALKDTAIGRASVEEV